MNGQSKSILLSVTFWGIVLGLSSPLLARYGITLPSDTDGLVNQIVGFIGDGIALYGRMRATVPLHIIAPPANSQGGFARIDLLIAIVIAALLCACAVTPKTPAQAIYEVESGYAAALVIAVQYKGLAPCGEPASPVLCANPPIVEALQKADDTAYAALSEAQTLVRTPGIGSDKIQTAVAAAQSALRVLTAITGALLVQ